MRHRLADFLWRWRFPLTAAIVLCAIAFIPRANITHLDNDVTAWFSKADPVYRDYERFRDEFGGSRTLIVALKADTAERLFSRRTLDFIEQVTGDIERVDTVQRVDSLATATTIEAIRTSDSDRTSDLDRSSDLPPSPLRGFGAAGGPLTSDGGLDVRPLLDPTSGHSPEQVMRRALNDDLLRGDLVSEDGRVTALVVSFDEQRIDQVRAGVIQAIHDIVDPKLPQGVKAYYNGSLEISETYNRITLENQRKFVPPILVITLIAVYVTFRSWRKMLLTIVAVGISILWTLGLYSLLGYSYNVLASMLVPLIVVLAIADDVHIMQHWDEERRRKSPEEAFKATVAHLATPLLGASGTTALGMASLATSNVVAVRSFGIGAAIGIMVDFAISLVFVPTLLSLMKAETGETPHEKYLIEPLRRVASFATRRPRQVIAIAIALSAVAAFGIVRLHVDTNHINFFSPRHPLGQSARVIDSDLSGVYSFQIMLEGPPDALNTPDSLRRMERVEASLRAMPNVKKVTSIADYVKRVNKELHDGDPAADVVPPDSRAIAQELFVLALSDAGRRELERMAASDYSRAQISVKLKSMSSDVVLQLVEQADAIAKTAFTLTAVPPVTSGEQARSRAERSEPAKRRASEASLSERPEAASAIKVTTTGSGRLFSTLDHYLVTSQVSSFGTAFFTVFGVIFVVFRSARFGFLTIAPNLLPVIAVLGIMGFMNISMNIATVMVASVALGVVDDDTIHFINRYRREIAAGATTDRAIELATVHEGRASLSTAIINSLGFGVLMLSEYKPTAWFGGLLGLTMAVAFLAEVFILPATITLLPSIFGADALRRPRSRAAAA